LTEPSNLANIGGMRGISRRLDDWIEASPWVAAGCTGVLLALVLTTQEWLLDDTPDWLFAILFSLTMALGVGLKGQSQRRRRDQR
jgi:predicted tellurium resistance membrane protein TerC